MLSRGLLLAACLAAFVLAGAVQAQDTRAPLLSPVLVLDRERLFAESQAGQAVLAQAEAERAELAAENRRIEAELTEEERALTEQRPILPPEEFRALAQAFDEKVVAIRRAQDKKGLELTQRRERLQQEFYRDALPIIAGLVRDSGAVLVMDRSAALLVADQIDITDAAIAQIDAQLDDDQTPPTAEDDATPDDGPAAQP
ncbi:OmpH family outer membrane protein [Rhodovulum adriaticum]|uniref:Periplasmic chaperone for outer membrane proteins Skp n=1 Tax=Rhodovulum adriaticum TaxID=35804 RepID=A0A4R2NTT7_RHOAD|nr:OmpH family outer membrane protein [Rhodovulum adriaticum]MBK1635078.1 hypothetical protein [Rhodovulum adriaticum]TCP25287.1 periplasmic chaperone for outer membrane proteins Skp [Rhodovulum adriaticum]